MDCQGKSCSLKKKEDKSNPLSMSAWLIIALLPKCPLCLLSYSTAISLCSGKTLFQDTVGWTSYIPIFLALVLIGTFIYNFKGRKTLKAILIAVLGCVIILFGEYFSKSIATYYYGTAVLLFACWVNGSFSFFMKKINEARERMRPQKV